MDERRECYFCHTTINQQDVYPLFGKYYICQKCRDKLVDHITEFVRGQ